MKRIRMFLVLMACLTGIAAGSSVSAKPGQHRAPGEHKVTAQQKAASDQSMQTGLAALQAASSAIQSGNAGQISSNLQSAVTAMQQALPIYQGHREKAIHAADAALKAMGGKGKREAQHVTTLVGRAIQDAQAALSTN